MMGWRNTNFNVATGPTMSDGSRPRNPAMEQGRVQAGIDERRRNLSPAARRALEEAEVRRKAADAAAAPAREIGGRGGKDPVRFGDWEIKGRAIDF